MKVHSKTGRVSPSRSRSLFVFYTSPFGWILGSSSVSCSVNSSCPDLNDLDVSFSIPIAFSPIDHQEHSHHVRCRLLCFAVILGRSPVSLSRKQSCMISSAIAYSTFLLACILESTSSRSTRGRWSTLSTGTSGVTYGGTRQLKSGRSSRGTGQSDCAL
jgi:hypothetical protein